MTSKQLAAAIDSRDMFKPSWGFPKVMGLVKQDFSSAWDQIEPHVKAWANRNAQIIREMSDGEPQWEELLYEIKLIIERDFWKKGSTRENKALQYLEQHYPQWGWVITEDWEDESQGIDIKSVIWPNLGVSVKGAYLRDKAGKMEQHMRQLETNDYEKVVLMEYNNKDELISIKVVKYGQDE